MRCCIDFDTVTLRGAHEIWTLTYVSLRRGMGSVSEADLVTDGDTEALDLMRVARLRRDAMRFDTVLEK